MASSISIKYFFLVFVVSLTTFVASGQEMQNENVISQWYESSTWLNGLELVPHESINKRELYVQFQLNRAWWVKAFEFLKVHNLDNLKDGKYIIEEGNVIAYVSTGPTKNIDQIKWESHKNFNDLQYIVKGKVKMGIISIDNSNIKITEPYDSKTDSQNYSVNEDEEEYYIAGPGTFFIFTPSDIHRPAIHVEGYEEVKKIIIKIRVP